jgi:hypothetical protein
VKFTSLYVAAIAVLVMASGASGYRDLDQASGLPDLSGMSWIEGDCFLAVHDAKISESGNPRVSLVYLPFDAKGITWKPQTVVFPGEESNDLESVARIPGTNDILLVESGDSSNDFKYQRIFRARVENDTVRVINETSWPVPVYNVEASAVAAIGERHVFLYAERAQNQPHTELRWAIFEPETLIFGQFQSVKFRNPDPLAFNRPLVAMDLDSSGLIHIASAFDAEAAGLLDPDNGPFSSAVYCIGKLILEDGRPRVTLFKKPKLEGFLQGFKVESVAIRESEEYGSQIFIGTDDENYGATMRLLAPPPGK